MKRTVFRTVPILFAFLISFLLCSCKDGSGDEPVFPFSDASWNSTKEDILKLEGPGYKTYDSVYGGICYTWPKTYGSHEGTVKYMLDDEDRLMCVAWACSSESGEELHTLYEQIAASVNEQYGEASSTDKQSNYGNVWYRREGNIVLSTMVTSSLKALQYAYLNPEVSTVSGN